MSDKTLPGNASLMPTELSEIRKPEKIRAFDYGAREEEETGRFSILHASTPPKSAKQENAKGPSTSKTNAKDPQKMGGKPTAGTTKKSTAQLSGSAKMAAAKKASGATASSSSSAKNYRAEYLKRKREREEFELAKRPTLKQQQEKLAEQRRLQEQETLTRVRARELMEQIRFWRQKFGTGEYESNHIRGVIASLEQELNGIDARYWG